MSIINRLSICGQERISIGYQLTASLVDDIQTKVPASNYVLIVDDPAHLDSFKFNKGRLLSKVVMPGTRSRQAKADIEDWLLSETVTRDSCFIAVGEIGDLVGSVASTFMRGVPFVQVPTSLHGFFSAISGRLTMDTPSGKDLIGTVYNPKHIYMDLFFVQSSSERQFLNDMAEVIQTAATVGESEFIKLENNVDLIRSVLNKDIQKGKDHTYFL
ncbi:Dehydroquinate synthase-like protein [Backusella circina FSU 941]|nr:Dehydroquinate synthase-like protein [Backusella circina FSU 941]